MTLSSKQAGNIIMFVVASIFAINIPISKHLLSGYISPVGLTASRISFGAIVFWITSLFYKQERVSLKDHITLFIGALFGIILNQGLFIYGLRETSPIDASIIITSSPLFAMVIAALLLKEPITLKKLLGVIVGGLGAILLVFNAHQNTTVNQVSSLAGNLAIVGCALFYSFYLVITRGLSSHYSPVTIMKWMFLYSFITIFPFTFREIIDASIFHQAEITPYLCLLYTLFGATFIAYMLIPMAQKRIRPTTISMYNNLQPLIASLIAISLGMDSFSIEKLMAGILIFSGVYLVTQSKAKAQLE